jgi:hypothetical protein
MHNVALASRGLDRSVEAMVVPAVGRLVAMADRRDRYRLLDSDGQVVVPVLITIASTNTTA